MKVKDFVSQFSHGNNIYVENRDNFRMYFYFNEDDMYGDDILDDWFLKYSDVADVEFIEVKQVYDGCDFKAITFKIDTDKQKIYADKVLAENAPLWFANRVKGVEEEGCCGG